MQYSSVSPEDNESKPQLDVSSLRAAPAKAPAKTSKKSLIDVSKFRAGASEVADSDGFGGGEQTTVLVKKPGKRNFFRVHPDPAYRLYNVPVIEGDDKELYLISSELELPEDVERYVSHVNLLTYISHKGKVAIWFYKNSSNSWSVSAGRVARRAEKEWVRMIPDFELGGYRVETAPTELRAIEPKWPSLSFDEIFTMAFESRQIVSLEDPIVRSLRGLDYGGVGE
jgi:hypothetical protein